MAYPEGRIECLSKKRLKEIKKAEEINDWHRRYKDRLIEKAGLSEDAAEQALCAGLGNYDYSNDPEDDADTEMSYWTD